MKIRRLSGVIAILALSRLFLSGAAASCPLVIEPVRVQHQHSASATGVAQHDESPSCEVGGAADCSGAQHERCLTMSSCANALILERNADVLTAETPRHPSDFVVALLLEPSRVPEPPPPRA